MRRVLLPLLLLAPAAAAGADEVAAEIRAALERGAAARAAAQAEAALEAYPAQRKLFSYLRTQARVAVARALQREHGYARAAAYLEQDIADRGIAIAYGRTCLWGGLEERGIAALRASGLPPDDTVWWECQLLAHLRRFDEIVARGPAGGADGRAWARWARERKTELEPLLERADNATRVAILAALVLLAACAALYRLAPAGECPGSKAG